MRILFDTNIWLAAFLTHGTCAELLEYCLEAHVLLCCPSILKELEEKLLHKFRFPKVRIKEILNFIQTNSLKIEAKPLSSPVCRDPEDDPILAAAMEGKADCLITGDEDLLILKRFKGIPILKPNQFWKFEKEF